MRLHRFVVVLTRCVSALGVVVLSARALPAQNTGSGAAFDFTVTNPGNIVAKITELAPVSTLTMGLSLGFWDATTSLCSQDISGSVTLNTTMSGQPPGPAQYCVGIYDVGNIQTATSFTIVVTHY